jgi:large subunit ribosomal protein L18
MSMILTGRERRKRRVRKKITGDVQRPRMSVFRSAKHISVQLIDDATGKTIAFASTYEKGFNGKGVSGNCKTAKVIGEAVAERAKQKGVEAVVFDRSSYRYHGRIKALADAARQKGLKF